MGDLFAKHQVVDIRMRVDVDQAYRAVFLGNSLENWIAEGVVPAQRQRNDVMLQNLVICVFDNFDRLFEVEGVNRDIPDIRDLKRVKRRHLGPHIIRADHRTFGADLPWSETCA